MTNEAIRAMREKYCGPFENDGDRDSLIACFSASGGSVEFCDDEGVGVAVVSIGDIESIHRYETDEYRAISRFLLSQRE